MLDNTAAPAAETATPAVQQPSAAPHSEQPATVVTREETTLERITKDEAELDAELRKVSAKARGGERDEGGRFASKEPKDAKTGKEAAPEQAGKAPEAKAEQDGVDGEVMPPEPKPLPAAFNMWPKQAKEALAKAPPELAQYLERREQEIQRGLTKAGQQLAEVAPVKSVLDKYKASFERNGLTFDQGIANLLYASDQLDKDPRGMIKVLADRYKVDLFDLAGQSIGQQPADPQIGQLMQTVQQLQAKLERYEQEGATRQRQHIEAQQQVTERAINDFAADKPDFDELADDMVPLIQVIQSSNPGWTAQQTLQEAYDRARWANPTTRQSILAQQAKTEAQKKAEAAKRAADEARSIRSLNVRGTADYAGTDDLDEELRAVSRKHRA